MTDIRTSALGGIPFGVNSGRPANAQPGQPYFNGQESRLEIYTQSGSWQNIVAETPAVISVQGVVTDTNTTNVITISGSNFFAGAIVSIIGSNGVEIVANTTVVNSIAEVQATFGAISAQYEPYDVKVLNTSNLYGLLNDGILVNQTPSWNTTAGLLGTFTEGDSVSIQLSATDPEGTTLSYTVTSGALPSGVTLSSSGLISGTLPGISTTTTYSFTVTVSDGVNTSIRTFSIASNAIAELSGGTLISSDSTYYYRVFSTTGTTNLITTGSVPVDYLLIGGGGGGGNSYGGGGGGAGGILSGSTTLSANTYPIVVGSGGGSTVSGSSTTAFGYTAGGGAFGVTSSGAGGNAGSPLTYVGGTGANASWGESGGGGAGGGANGGNGVASSQAGVGGAGSNLYSSWLTAINSVMPSAWQTATSSGSGRIAGGGGGGGARDTNSNVGGAGGGGNGGGYNSSSDQPGVAGIANTGSGGGGSRGASTGGAGGSGLAIIRYTKASVGG